MIIPGIVKNFIITKETRDGKTSNISKRFSCSHELFFLDIKRQRNKRDEGHMTNSLQVKMELYVWMEEGNKFVICLTTKQQLKINISQTFLTTTKQHEKKQTQLN